MMSKYPADKIRNVCLVGHGRAGKTTLCEAMLYHAGAIDRFGNVADGTTTTDYDPEETKRNFSISTAVAPFEWKGYKVNVIDAPGYFDFVGGVFEGLRGCDSAAIVISAKTGVAVGTENAFRYAVKKKLPVCLFISKLENEHADYNGILEQIKSRFGTAVVPFHIPILENGKVTGFVDVVNETAYSSSGFDIKQMPVPESMQEQLSEVRTALIEQIAETDEELMEKYFDGQDFTEEEIKKGIKQGICESIIIPVFAGDVINGCGVELFMDALISYLPSPRDMQISATDKKSGEEIALASDDNADLAAVVFKTVADPYVGKLSIFRVVSGVMRPDTTVYNATKETNEKIGRLYLVRGKKQIETDSIGAGDIGAVTKLAVTNTGDTLCKAGTDILLAPVEYPAPVISLAILPVAKGDEEKIHAGLIKLREEDPTFNVTNNAETHQMLIEGQGEQHLDIIVSKLKSKFGVDVKLEDPIVPYREAIKGTAKVEGKHKKQSGGHGQYGHVVMEFAPGTQEGLEFSESVFGGSVPKNYFPAVEKGIRESMQHGVLAGYPVVSLKATLLDGSYHPVDSSEMAFKVAASLAFKAGMTAAKPVLLEPIGYLKANVPESLMGDVIGDINKRRGRILGMGTGEIEAEVPVAEMFKYATDLRSMTQGRGSFSFDFVRYEEAPSSVAEKVIAEANRNQKDTDK